MSVFLTSAQAAQARRRRATSSPLLPGRSESEELRNALPTDLTRWMDREGQFKQRLGVAFNSRRGRRFGKRQMRVERASADAHGKVARWKVVAGA